MALLLLHLIEYSIVPRHDLQSDSDGADWVFSCVLSGLGTPIVAAVRHARGCDDKHQARCSGFILSEALDHP